MLTNNRLASILCLGLLLLAATAKAQTPGCGRLYVDSAVTASGNGNSWVTAFKTVSQALDSVNNGSCSSREIWVAKGTYYPMAGLTTIASSPDSSFRILRNGIKIYGGFAGTETTLSARNIITNTTILSGNIGASSSYHVLTVVSNNTIDTNTRLDGFAVRDGYASTTGTFNIAGKVINRSAGGGIHIRSSSPAIANCTFSLNTGASGGGMYNNDSSPTITNCIFSSNTGISNINSPGGNGGGMCNVSASSPVITNCTFSSNSSVNTGGAIYNQNSSPFLNNCTFTYNISSLGGAVNNTSNSSIITNCVFAYNSISTLSSGRGAGIFNNNSSSTITNCVFAFNDGSSGSGGGIANGGNSPVITSCTFYANSTGEGGGGIWNQLNSSPIIANCILWGNVSSNNSFAADIYNYNPGNTSPSTPTITYCNTQTPQQGVGNSTAYPFFIDTANAIGPDCLWRTADDGLRLTTCSPAINTGNNAAIPAGITTDIRDTTRIQNTTVDKGAYEMEYNSIGGSSTTITASVTNPVCSTTAITFTATTITPGTVPAYQWFKNGVAVGTNTTTYTNSSWSNGDSVWIVHTNNNCNITDTSNKKYVQLVPVPAQPGTISGPANPCPGTQTYSVSAVTGATTYTWSVPTGWVITAGQGTTSVTVTSTSAAGSVTVTANNSCGVASVSRSSTVTPLTAPAVPTGPAAVCASSTGNVYSVPAVAGATTYTWSVPTGWTITSGQGTTSITLTAAAGNTSGTVGVSTGNTCQTSSSTGLAVTGGNVVPALLVVSNSGTGICAGTLVTFTATPTNGGTAPIYQWKKNGTNVGTNTITYTDAGLVTGDVITVTLTTNIACASTSTVTATAPAITVTPVAVPLVSISGSATLTLCVGVSNTFLASSTNGGTAAAYQWYKNGVAISGATGSSYTGSAFANNDSVYVVLTSNATCRTVDTVRSSAVKLTVYPYSSPTLIVGSNSGNTICQGTPVIFTATPINGGTAPSYQWKKNGVNVGTNSATYSDNTLATGDVISITLTSNSPCAVPATVTASGPPITVVPNVTPTLSINGPSTVALCAGAIAAFTTNSTAGGPTPTYQWYKNGVAIPGQTAPVYTGFGFASGDSIWVVFKPTAACRLLDSVRSSSVKLTVNPNVVPVLTVTASPGTSVPAGGSVTFTATVTATGTTPTYQWFKNGVAITGATSSTYTTNSLQNGDLISVRASALGPCATPNALTSTPLRISDPAGIPVVGGKGSWQESLLLHPNPNSGQFTVSADWGAVAAGEKVWVEVVNALGQVVFRKAVQPAAGRWNLDIQLQESLANGVYQLRVVREREGSVVVRPVLLQR